jgi:3-dehydroquinate synthase
MLERAVILQHTHRILFTRDAFSSLNTTVRNVLELNHSPRKPKVLVFIDDRVALANPGLSDQIMGYAAAHSDALHLTAEPFILPGGEACKNDFRLVEQCWKAINEAGLDRHSYVFVIGGGAVLDLVCFASATAHRGIRHVRFPTTTLSQGDGGVGVKNGVNYVGKKNWVGSFAVPYAVINDFAFLDTLPERERRNGIIEAIKVALIRDAAFYQELEGMGDALARLESAALERTIQRSAELHVEHICTGGDPFEMGSARPLDFGHWVAHKLEQVSQFAIAHGEAVAIGMAIDLLYSVKRGILEEATAQRIIALIERIGFATCAPQLLEKDARGELTILAGLEEFREHLGGELTITLVPEIGRKLEVHEMDRALIIEAVQDLRERAKGKPAGFVQPLIAAEV